MTYQDFKAIAFPDVQARSGSPMGRRSDSVSDRPTDRKVYDRRLPGSGDYDRGGAYWGTINGGRGLGPVRVEFTADREYVRYYRD